MKGNKKKYNSYKNMIKFCTFYKWKTSFHLIINFYIFTFYFKVCLIKYIIFFKIKKLENESIMNSNWIYIYIPGWYNQWKLQFLSIRNNNIFPRSKTIHFLLKMETYPQFVIGIKALSFWYIYIGRRIMSKRSGYTMKHILRSINEMLWTSRGS